MTDIERHFPCTGTDIDDVFVLMHERIRKATTHGGFAALQELLSTEEGLLQEEAAFCRSWCDYQGQFLGVFGAFFYFYDSNVDRIRLVNKDYGDGLSLNPPTLDVRDGQWFVDESRHAETLDQLESGRQDRRGNVEEDAGHVEFYRAFLPSTGQVLFTDAERQLNVLLCPDGEVGYFIFEYILRQQFQSSFDIEGMNGEVEKAISRVSEQDALNWVSGQFQPLRHTAKESRESLFLKDNSFHVSERLEAYGLLGNDGSATQRCLLTFEWLDLQREYDALSDRRFLNLEGNPWFQSWLPPDVTLVQMCNEQGPLQVFRHLAGLLIEPERRRSACSVNDHSRFFIPSHMTYRYRDSGIPKTIFAVPLGNVGEERQSVAFVVGACHLEYDGTTLSQRQFWDGLSLRNRRSLSSALTALGMMGEAIESGLREKAAIVAAKKTANEKFVDATVRTFSIITHETKSLFLKHFLDLRNRLEVEARTNDLAEEVCYAWDRMAASTSVAYLFSKVVSVGNAESASEDYELAITQIHSHFLEPLARMFIQGRLETALRFVAANVLAREIDNATVRVFPFCEQPKDQSVSECNLSPEEFSHCYMLITEPLRNFLNYGRDCEAEWDLDVSRSGIVATLNQQQNSGSYGLPVSQTFRSLGEFLKVVNGCEARSDEIEVRGRPGFSWRVVIAGAAWKQALRKVEEEQANFEKN